MENSLEVSMIKNEIYFPNEITKTITGYLSKCNDCKKYNLCKNTYKCCLCEKSWCKDICSKNIIISAYFEIQVQICINCLKKLQEN